MQSHHAPIRLLAVLILLAAGLAACDTTGSRLRAIDGIIEDDPARALAELQLMPTAGRSHADSAYYALLYTQAQIKNYINVDSDSLISIAYDAYKFSGNRDLRRRTHFYQAQVAYYRGDYRNAMQDAIVAYDIAKEEDNPYWIAKTAELMGDLFSNVYNFEQAESFVLTTVDNYLKAGRIRNHRFAICDLATVYVNENNMDMATFLLDSLKSIIESEEPLDSALERYVTAARYSILLHNNRLDELKETLPDEKDSSTCALEKIDAAIYRSYTLTNPDSLENTSTLLSSAYSIATEDEDRVRVMYAEYIKLKQSAPHSRALELADSLLHIQSNIAEKHLKESVTIAQRDYYSSKADYQQHHAKIMRRGIVGITLVSIIVCSLLIFIHRLRMRTKKAELETNLLALMHLREQMQQISNDNQRLTSELTKTSATLFRDKWSTLNMLCNEYFEKGDSAQTRAHILNSIEKELDRLRSPSNLSDIEASVNKYLGNIMILLKQECPFLKEGDFVFISLIFAGLSVRAVCLFTDMKYKMYYLKKSRLTKRILASDAPHRQLFIDKLK